MPTPWWHVTDRDGVRIRVGSLVTVVDTWNPAAMAKGVGAVVAVRHQPHHVVLVGFPDNSTDWVLAGLVVVEHQQIDAAMAAIVNAPDVDAARAVCADLPPRVLRGLADLMHLPTGGRRAILTARVIAEARG